MYYAIGASVSSLHRESTDSPIYMYIHKVYVTIYMYKGALLKLIPANNTSLKVSLSIPTPHTLHLFSNVCKAHV